MQKYILTGDRETERGRVCQKTSRVMLPGQRIVITDSAFSFVETRSLQQIAEHRFTEMTVPIPPNRPCVLRLCRITSSGVIAPGRYHSSRNGGITCRSPKRAVRKIFCEFYIAVFLFAPELGFVKFGLSFLQFFLHSTEFLLKLLNFHLP